MYMSFLVVVTGIIVGFWSLGVISAITNEPELGPIVVMLIIEAALAWLHLRCVKKRKSPEYKAKQKKAQEEKEELRERRRLYLEKYNQEQKEIKRKRHTVVSTRLIGEGAAEYKKSVGDMVVRGAVGSMFGPVGAAVGMATTKSKNTNKNKRRFLVKYEDGHIEEMEVTVGGILYKHYMEKLEWEHE